MQTFAERREGGHAMLRVALIQVVAHIVGQAGEHAGGVADVEGGVVATDEGLGGGGHGTILRRRVRRVKRTAGL